MPGYSQLARLEPTVFRRRSRRLQLTSLEQLPKSKTANLITSSALGWECPVNGITSAACRDSVAVGLRSTIRAATHPLGWSMGKAWSLIAVVDDDKSAGKPPIGHLTRQG